MHAAPGRCFVFVTGSWQRIHGTLACKIDGMACSGRKSDMSCLPGREGRREDLAELCLYQTTNRRMACPSCISQLIIASFFISSHAPRLLSTRLPQVMSDLTRMTCCAQAQASREQQFLLPRLLIMWPNYACRTKPGPTFLFQILKILTWTLCQSKCISHYTVKRHLGINIPSAYLPAWELNERHDNVTSKRDKIEQETVAICCACFYNDDSIFWYAR